VELVNVGVFDAIVVNDEAENNGIGGVGKKAWLGLVVAVGKEVSDHLLVGVKTGLPKTIHGFRYLGKKIGAALGVSL
jgi:hypothetical protein